MKHIHSLRLKIIGGILLMALVISTVLVGISYVTYERAMNDQYETQGNHIAMTAISLLDGDQVREYVEELGQADAAQVMETPEYQQALALLRDIKESNEVLYLYMMYPTETGVYYIFDTDESEEAIPYGGFLEYYGGGFSDNIDAVLNGERVPALISNEDYGWIISISYPYFYEGELLGYVCTDISMDQVVADRLDFLKNCVMVIAGVTVLFALLYVLLFNTILIRPIRRITEATSRFVAAREKDEDGETPIRALTVSTGDELEQLCDSLKKMEEDLNIHIGRLREVTAEKERISAELSVATQIQASMLPCIFPPFPERNEFDIFASMNPAKEVGGDFYDFFLIDRDHLGLVMADVSGKGVPAALFMVISKTLLKNQAMTGQSPREILMTVNNQLCENNEAEMFVTVWMGIYEISTGKLTASNAGHEYPAIRRAGGSFELYKDRHGFVMAGMENAVYRDYQLQLEEGDTLFVYTDGVTEATNRENELFGTERMLVSLNRDPNRAPRELLADMKRDIDTFVGGRSMFDDITMLALKVRQHAGKSRNAEKNTAEELTIQADLENLDQVQAFIAEILEKAGCTAKTRTQIELAVEEIYVNIAHYAYPSETGSVTVRCSVQGDPIQAVIQFRDEGIPFNPLEKEDADITLPAEERQIGGLGILMVKKTMNAMEYRYEDGKNILTLRKTL